MKNKTRVSRSQSRSPATPASKIYRINNKIQTDTEVARVKTTVKVTQDISLIVPYMQNFNCYTGTTVTILTLLILQIVELNMKLKATLQLYLLLNYANHS